MNKKSWILILLTLSSVFSVMAPRVNAALSTPFLSENFSTFNRLGWDITETYGGDVQCVTSAGYENYGLNCSSPSTPSGAQAFIDHQVAQMPGNQCTLDFKAYLPSAKIGTGMDARIGVISSSLDAATFGYLETSYNGSDYVWEYNNVESDLLISFDSWTQCRITYSNVTDGFVTFFINGDMIGNVTGDYSAYSLCDSVSVGSISQLVNLDFEVWIDDVHFYSSAILTADLEDVDDDGADWVFTDWRYYHFQLMIFSSVDNASLQFELPTSYENVTVGVFANSSSQVYASALEIETREGEPMRLGSVSFDYNSSSGITTIVFPLWFESNCLDLWNPDTGVDIYFSIDGSVYSLLALDFFRIYSEGGFQMNYDTGGADESGLIAGGTAFSFYAYNGSSVYNEIWYRDLQHVKLLPDVSFLTGYEQFSLYYGLDISLGNGNWSTVLYCRLLPDTVSYTGAFAGNVWINMSCQFWNSTDLPVVMDDVYMFYHGSVAGAGDPGHWKSWIDLWFSDKESNGIISGRVNAYEYPMIDNADLWLRWLANNWGVKDDVMKESSIEIPLVNEDGNQIHSESVIMVRLWCNLTVSDSDAGQLISIDSYDAFDVTHSSSLPLTGISAPVFDETKTPTVGNTGILGALWTMFSGLGSWLSENVIFGGLNLWGTFVDFLDTIASWFGAPKFFTNLFGWIGDAVTYLGTSFDYLIGIVADVFTLFGSLLGSFLTTMSEIITSFVNLITTITDLLGGAYAGGVDLWETLGISSWITAAIIFYPIYLVILWDTEGMDAVIKQLTWIFGLLSWVFDFMSGVIMEAITLITSLIESIPVAE